MPRPWVKTVFGNSGSGFQSWAARQGLTTEEEFQLVSRVGVGGRTETVIAITGSRCFICPGEVGTAQGTSAYTDIELAEIESVSLMGGPILSSVVIDTRTDIYRLPATFRPRAARIASTIADGTELVPNRPSEGSDPGRLRSTFEELVDRSPRSGLTFAVVGSGIAFLGALVGQPAAGLIVGLVVIIAGLSLALLVGLAKHLPFPSMGPDEWIPAGTRGRGEDAVIVEE